MRLSLVALALALSFQPALAGWHNFVVPVNGSIKALWPHAINPDCSVIGYPVVRVTSGPSHGRVTAKKGVAYPNFPPENPRSQCNKRRVPATIVDYRPDRDFSGADSFAVEVIFPSGNEAQETYNITVK